MQIWLTIHKLHQNNNMIIKLPETIVTPPRSRRKRRSGSEGSRRPRRRRPRRGARAATSPRTSSPPPPEQWVHHGYLFDVILVCWWSISDCHQTGIPTHLFGVSLDGIYLPPNQTIQTGLFRGTHIATANYKTQICFSGDAPRCRGCWTSVWIFPQGSPGRAHP